MTATSMLYTMGMALDRAAERGLGVRLLVDGEWIDGQVVANDGTGVVLECPDGGHAVVRNERIGAVKVHAASPFHRPIEDGHEYAAGSGGEGTYRMPHPRSPQD